MSYVVSLLVRRQKCCGLFVRSPDSWRNFVQVFTPISIRPLDIEGIIAFRERQACAVEDYLAALSLPPGHW